MRSRLSRFIPIILLALVAGCSTHVTVTGKYPTPLSSSIPAHAGILLDDSFRAYTYLQDNNSGEVTIQLGDAQARLFNTIFASLFDTTSQLTARPDGTNPALDLIIVPQVEEMQIAQPYDNQLEVYEVWIKYNLQVLDNRGETIADWIMTAYGKTPSRTLTSSSEALNQASIVALRDAGARITTSFTRVPEINQWLAERPPRSAATSAASDAKGELE